MKRRGYLFLECAVVLAIIIFFASLAISFHAHFSTMHLEGEVRRIEAFLRYIWIKSIQEGKDIAVTIALQPPKLDAQGEVCLLSEGISWGVISGAYGPPSRPSRALSDYSTFNNHTITFYKDGSVTAGSLYIIDKGSRSMYAISIPLPDSFFVRMYRYEHSVWKLV